MRQILLFLLLVTQGIILAQATISVKKAEILFEERIGVKPPKELIDFWIKAPLNKDTLQIAAFGDFIFLYPDNILEATLKADAKFSRVDLMNRYQIKKNKGEISEAELDEILPFTKKDPMLMSQDINSWLVNNSGSHLTIKYTIAIAVAEKNYGQIFYGYDAAKKIIGIFYWYNDINELPIYLGKNINDVINKYQESVNLDFEEYIKKNCQFQVKTDYYAPLTQQLPDQKQKILEFYENSCNFIFGEKLEIDTDEDFWTFSAYKGRTASIFRIEKMEGYQKQVKKINTYLNLHLNDYKRVVSFGYYRLKYGYIAVLSKSQVIDFAQKGLIETDHFTLPLEVFTGEQ